MTNAAVLDHQASILNHANSRPRKLLRGGIIANAELEPNVFWLHREDVIDVRRDVVRTSKHIHHVDRSADFGELAKDRFPEDLRDIGVVNGNGDDVVAGG